MGSFDGKSYRKHESVGNFLDFALQDGYRSHWFYAHNGGRFDFQFLLKELETRKIPFRLMTLHARIAMVTLRKNGRKFRFVDSACLLPGSLARISETFATQHTKLVGEIDFQGGERVNKNNPAHIRYNEHDCRALYESIQAFYSDPILEASPMKVTLPSLSMDVFRRHFLRESIPQASAYTRDFVRQSYFGGRCEIFRLSGINLTGYDVNSLFPYCMENYPMPVRHVGRCFDSDAFGFHDVTIEIPENQTIPVLPVHHAEKLIFPTGVIRGVFFSPELQLAIKNGAKILKYHRGERFTEEKDLFSGYVNYFYKQRMDNPGQNPKNLIAKLFLNSHYGKYGQKSEKEMVVSFEEFLLGKYRGGRGLDKNREFGPMVVAAQSDSPHHMVNLSAAITSWARVKMASEYYIPLSDSLFYTDTDSVFTSERLCESSGLGGLKKEYSVQLGIFILPKGYYLKLADGTEIRRLKGFPKRYLDTLSREEFTAGKFKFSEKRFATFRSSVIRTGEYLSMADIKKSVLSAYSKRRILLDGKTEPWHFKRGKIINDHSDAKKNQC